MVHQAPWNPYSGCMRILLLFSFQLGKLKYIAGKGQELAVQVCWFRLPPSALLPAARNNSQLWAHTDLTCSWKLLSVLVAQMLTELLGSWILCTFGFLFRLFSWLCGTDFSIAKSKNDPFLILSSFCSLLLPGPNYMREQVWIGSNDPSFQDRMLARHGFRVELKDLQLRIGVLVLETTT